MPYVGQKPADIIATAVDTTTGTFSGEVDAASLDISGNIDVDGTTNLDVVDIDGAVDMASTLAVAGAVTANAGVVVDEMTLDADTLTATDDFIIDAVGDITLDADGGSIVLKDGGTQFGLVAKVSEGLGIYASVADKDIFFKGTDGSSNITALTLDMSAGGNAIFNAGLAIGGTGAANTLDDYEEGTWTPTLTGASSGTRAMDSGVKAVYTKVGNLVTAHMVAGIGGLTGSASGGARLGGLPFNYNGSNNEIMGKVHVTDVDLPSGIIECTLLSASSGTTNVCFFVNMFDNANHGELGLSAFDGDSTLRIVVTYHAV